MFKVFNSSIKQGAYPIIRNLPNGITNLPASSLRFFSMLPSSRIPLSAASTPFRFSKQEQKAQKVFLSYLPKAAEPLGSNIVEGNDLEQISSDTKNIAAKTSILSTPIGDLKCQRHTSTVMTIKSFLSEEECQYLCNKCQNLQQTKAGSVLGTFKANQVDLLQFCTDAFFRKNPRDEVIDKILSKLSIFLNALNGNEIIERPPSEINLDDDLEQLLIIHYKKNEGKFGAHFDNEPFQMGNMRNRLATILIYLNSVEKGGTTRFTKTDISIQPEMGDLLFFYNYDPKSENPNKANFSSPEAKFSSIPKKSIKWYPESINQHEGCIPESNDKYIISAFIMEHMESWCRSSGDRSSRDSLPLGIMPSK